MLDQIRMNIISYESSR